MFDLYGTLVISGSGDVGSADEVDRGVHLDDAYAAVGWHESPEGLPSIEDLHRQIRSVNEAARASRGEVDDAEFKPEVDIVDVWRQTFSGRGLPDLAANAEAVVRLAAEYESRANPTWPMPGAAALLTELRRRGLPLGIVSNAQVFTTPLVEELAGGPLEVRGFDLDLCIFSYRFRQAKPARRLFEALARGLERASIAPASVLYVGNDMLNDVWAAGRAELRTAWFAGDARSCRPRDGDPRCAIESDVVLTELSQLLDCLGPGGAEPRGQAAGDGSRA